MWTLSGFIDEISDDFSLQCKIANGLGLRYVEVRSAWGTNILDLDSGQLSKLRETLAEYELQVSSIGSPIGKITIDDEFPPHLERMRHAVEVAETLEAPYIRIFSFFIPEGTDPDSRRDEVLSRMSALAEVAAGRRRDLGAREREGHLWRYPSSLPGHRHHGVCAPAAARLGSG